MECKRCSSLRRALPMRRFFLEMPDGLFHRFQIRSVLWEVVSSVMGWSQLRGGGEKGFNGC